MDPAPPTTPRDEPAPRVADVLQQIRSGVRQRQAEEATGRDVGEQFRHQLLELRRHEFVREPVPVSHRGRVGRVIVLFKKATFHLLLKWLQRPLIEQQNAFNQAVSRLLQQLVETREREALERRELAARLADLERRLGGG